MKYDECNEFFQPSIEETRANIRLPVLEFEWLREWWLSISTTAGVNLDECRLLGIVPLHLHVFLVFRFTVFLL